MAVFELLRLICAWLINAPMPRIMDFVQLPGEFDALVAWCIMRQEWSLIRVFLLVTSIMQNYSILSALGAGTFATVHRATRNSDGRLVAIKEMRMECCDWEQVKKLPEASLLPALPKTAKEAAPPKCPHVTCCHQLRRIQ